MRFIQSDMLLSKSSTKYGKMLPKGPAEVRSIVLFLDVDVAVNVFVVFFTPIPKYGIPLGWMCLYDQCD